MLLIDGVNKCLRAIGEIPVPDGIDLDTLDPLHEAVQIRTIIQEVNRELQIKGWWFNREEWEFIPDTSTGRINVPVTVISLKGVSTTVVLKGNDLYDVDNKTLVFTSPINCDVVFEQSFESTPESFATWAVFKAAVEAQWTFKGDDTADKKLEKKVMETFITFEREHMRNKDYNLITSGRLADRTTNPTAVAG